MSRVALSACLAAAACGDGDTPPADGAPIVDGPALQPLPDLRFKWVGASPVLVQNSITNLGFFRDTGMAQIHDQMEFAWTPLELTLDGLIPGHYDWQIADFTPQESIEPFRATAKAGPIAALDQDLAGEGVVVSIDLHADAYAFTTARPQAGAPDYATTSFELPRGELDARIATEAGLGSVVTALSASPTTAGNVRAYAASRDGDSTAYEIEVRDVTAANAFANATALADAGYIITAFGRVGDDAAIMVGTRAPGAAARTVTLQTTPELDAGDAVVAWLFATPNDLVIVQR
ncbi:MAG: hypothetical protein H0V17_34790 [Deltaproteobacteria bacterium]|nr:hypothetical protein [Deltaproteobacteria bacterium]